MRSARLWIAGAFSHAYVTTRKVNHHQFITLSLTNRATVEESITQRSGHPRAADQCEREREREVVDGSGSNDESPFRRRNIINFRIL